MSNVFFIREDEKNPMKTTDREDVEAHFVSHFFFCATRSISMRQSAIKIIDKPCGLGKTTSMINGFEPLKKYLVIVPLLTEVQRVIEQSRRVAFVQPHSNDNDRNTKFSSLEEHLLLGCNVVTTHKMYESIVPLAKSGLLDDYHIIIDEVPDSVTQVSTKSETSIDEFYISSGYMTVDSQSGLVKPTQKWIDAEDRVSDTLSSQILKAAMTGCLYLQDKKMFIWALPKVILEAGVSCTVLTYKSEGSLFLAYLRKIGVGFEVERDVLLEKQFIEAAARLITIEDMPSLSKQILSFTGQSKGQSNQTYCKKVSTSLKNLRERKMNGVAVKDILITCKKDAWIVSNNDNTKLGSFAKGSRLGEANWIANTTRGTNDYSHCSHLVYLYDQHPNHIIMRWLGDSSSEFKNAYALTELIQWVWRSRIRNGEPITLYLPSNRMRSLFKSWLYSQSNEMLV